MIRKQTSKDGTEWEVLEKDGARVSIVRSPEGTRIVTYCGGVGRAFDLPDGFTARLEEVPATVTVTESA